MGDLILTRRRLLFSAGAGVLGISVVSTLSGCSGSSDDASPGVAPPGPSTTGSSPAAEGSGDGAVAEGWRRVDLSFVSAYVLIRGNEAAVVDLGTEGSAASVEAALKAGGSGWDSLRHVILTHQHRDHAGGLAEVAPLVSATLYAGEADVAAISSPTRLKPVNDGDEVFGLRIVGTPGHTAGHVAVFDPSTGVLVTGDALRTTAGLTGPDPQYTADMTQATASVRKLAGLDVRVILPGHGAPLTADAGEELKRLAASLPAG